MTLFEKKQAVFSIHQRNVPSGHGQTRGSLARNKNGRLLNIDLDKYLFIDSNIFFNNVQEKKAWPDSIFQAIFIYAKPNQTGGWFQWSVQQFEKEVNAHLWPNRGVPTMAGFVMKS